MILALCGSGHLGTMDVILMFLVYYWPVTLVLGAGGLGLLLMLFQAKSGNPNVSTSSRTGEQYYV